MLGVEGITKAFGKKKALDTVTFNVDRRSLSGLLGPPGSGKTTLLRIIAGLDAPDAGAIYLNQQDITTLEPAKRKIGFVFEEFNLYTHLKVYDNIAFPLKATHMAKNEIDNRVKSIARFLEIEDKLRRQVSHLSGGEKQRIAIARALVRGSDVNLYLLDEPFTNLDFKLREKMATQLRLMQHDLGIPMIYSSADPESTMIMCDHIGVLSDGKLNQYDTVEEVYSRPADAFVGTYLGKPPMNLLDCSVRRTTGGKVLDARLFRVDLSAMRNPLESIGDQLVIGLRPEHLDISETRPVAKNDVIAFQAEHYLSEVRGSNTVVYVKADDTVLQVLKPAIYRHDTEVLWVSCKFDYLYLFDKDTGKILKGLP